MYLTITRKDSTRRVPLLTEGQPYIIGRAAGDFVPDIDLAPNPSVSRRHARLWRENGTYWIEDMGSCVGTLVGGVQIKGTGRHPLSPGVAVVIGRTTFQLDEGGLSSDALPGPDAVSDQSIDGTPAETEHVSCSTESLGEILPPESPEVAMRLLGVIQQLTTMFVRQGPSEQIARTLMLRLRDLVPAADHVALLLFDERTSDLALAAHEPEGDPRGSSTLAHLAIERGRAMVWVREKDGAPDHPGPSIADQQLESVLCAPLACQGKSLGALWLSSSRTSGFSETDLRVAAALAQHAAIAVSGQRVWEDLVRSGVILKRIMAHFSPHVAARLLDQASRGRLRPGGVTSPVTILCCDLRGFTRTTADMAADDIVDMLNEYFAELAAILLRHNGTVDKFIGDAILAVFGSPEPDPNQYGNAVDAACEMQRSMEKINAGRATRGVPALKLGIGIHCGVVLHGFIGSEERLEFTVIGDAVNKASRLTEGAGPGQIIISNELHQVVWKSVKARRTQIRTKHEGELTAFILEEE